MAEHLQLKTAVDDEAVCDSWSGLRVIFEVEEVEVIFFLNFSYSTRHARSIKLCDELREGRNLKGMLRCLIEAFLQNGSENA